MNILIYYQNSYHTVFLESLVQGFVQKGHKVVFLTTTARGLLHNKVESLGGQTFTYVPDGHRLILYFKHWWFLIRFCRRHKIDVVYSHLQYVNLIAVLAQKFIKAKVFPCRHHLDDSILNGNKNALRTDKLVNRFSRKLIVVSEAVKKHLISNEHVLASKIEVIPLGYDFTLYDQPDPVKVNLIRDSAKCELLLIVIGRMNENKKHITALEVFYELIRSGLDVKIMLLDRGEKEQELKEFVTKYNLQEKVIFTGFLNNLMDYLAASDLLIHPSISEASNQVIKEAALCSKTGIVVDGVGDFNEFIIHDKNGFLVSRQNTVAEMVSIIKEYYSKKNKLNEMGQELNQTVRRRFAIAPVLEQYLKLNNHTR